MGLEPMCESDRALTVLTVILNWNNARATLACVESLLCGEFVPDRVVVVDNNSTEPASRALSAALPDGVQFLALNENRGYAGGLQAGLDECSEQQFDVAWFLNNDTAVGTSTLKVLLLSYQDHGDGFLYSPRILRSADSSVYFSGYWLNERTGHFFGTAGRGEKRLAGGRFGEICSDVIQGASFVVPFAVLRRHGFMSEEFFLYWEEFDYCYRLSGAGIRCLCVSDAVMLHEVEGSTSGIEYVDSPSRTYYRTRNKLCFWKAHFGLLRTTVYTWRMIRYQCIDGLFKRRCSRDFILGVFHGVLGRTGPLEK
jgi:GT2 family glycosyltransferase